MTRGAIYDGIAPYYDVLYAGVSWRSRASRDAEQAPRAPPDRPPAHARRKLKRTRRLRAIMVPLAVSTVVLDVTDMERAVRFWSAALGYEEASRHETFVALHHPEDPQRCRIGFQPADEPKRGVNPLHLDLGTDDIEREAERLVALGATRVPDWPYEDDGTNWIVLRDPDGHEFCVVERPRERLVDPDG